MLARTSFLLGATARLAASYFSAELTGARCAHRRGVFFTGGPTYVRRSLVLILAVTIVACTSESPTSVMAPGQSTAARGAIGTVGTVGTVGGGGGGGTGGGSGSVDSPHFIDTLPGAPTIANPVITFWARKGVDQTISMYYHALPGRHDSTTYYSLRVRAQSLFRRPDGSLIANGDSVQITITLTDLQHLVVDCQPSGLLFDPSHPATAKFSYANASHDLDGSGTVTSADTALLHALSVWRRETPTSPWIIVPSTGLFGSDEVAAAIAGFTGYALAW